MKIGHPARACWSAGDRGRRTELLEVEEVGEERDQPQQHDATTAQIAPMTIAIAGDPDQPKFGREIGFLHHRDQSTPRNERLPWTVDVDPRPSEAISLPLSAAGGK